MTEAIKINDADLPRQVVDALRSVCGDGPVVLHEPRFGGKEWDYVKDCLDSTFVSSVGQYVDRFEADLAAYTGAAHAVAVVNGTAALHVALVLAGVQPGDEVLMPALTFIATANAVKYCGAEPHFVDCCEDRLGMAPVALRAWLEQIAELKEGVCFNKQTKRPIRAMVPMHVFGHPCDMNGLQSVARDFGLVIVEDAAESLGSYYEDQHTGTIGLMGTLSFNGNKTITTGGGGAILTNDADLAKRAKHITTTAKRPHKWAYEHDEVGFNYRLPNINAALGCAQLEQLEGFLASKRRLYERYSDVFSAISGASLVGEPTGCKSNFWLQAILLEDEAVGTGDLRDVILEATNAAGYMTRPAWTLMHKMGMFDANPRSPLPVAERLERRIINIPSSAGLV